MADHFVAVARGVEGMKASDFTVGTSSASTALFELRILDGVTPRPRKTEVLKAIKAFERFFENHQQVTAAGFDIDG
jgi:hypothetical protein